MSRLSQNGSILDQIGQEEKTGKHSRCLLLNVGAIPRQPAEGIDYTAPFTYSRQRYLTMTIGILCRPLRAPPTTEVFAGYGGRRYLRYRRLTPRHEKDFPLVLGQSENNVASGEMGKSIKLHLCHVHLFIARLTPADADNKGRSTL